MNPRLIVILATVAGLAILSGCATRPDTLYYWGDYQNQVYDYLQNADSSDISNQIQALEDGYEKARSVDMSLPPGYHAQLGILYYAQGNDAKAIEQLELEKSAFPESTLFIDRLLAQFKK